jgi:rhodanese-related sulfurtransferase
MNRILILFALCVAQTSFSEEHEDWRSIRPQVTTEAELVARFGAPAEVVTTFPWSEWTAKWKKRPIVSRFTLRYTIQESKSPLLDGPAGPADSVEVAMHDSKVVSVMWRYGGSSAKAAAQLLRANSNLKMGPQRQPRELSAVPWASHSSSNSVRTTLKSTCGSNSSSWGTAGDARRCGERPCAGGCVGHFWLARSCARAPPMIARTAVLPSWQAYSYIWYWSSFVSGITAFHGLV